jgi:hypothetical protein
VHGVHSGGIIKAPDCSNWNPQTDWSTFGHLEFALNVLRSTLVTAQ